MNEIAFTLDFADPGATQTRQVGGKAHGLAAMTQAGIPVAPGFAVTTRAYRDHLDRSGLGARLASLLAALDRDSIGALEQAEARIRDWFEYTPLDDAVRAPIVERYARLGESVGRRDLPVAVRSSATAEDAAGTSFAGEYETFIGVRGDDAVDLHVRRCWASVYSARALSYAWKNGIDPLAVEMAVVVQKVVAARAAGVMFTVSPLSGDRSRIVVEASWGLGLAVVGGEVTPDRWVVSKVERQILECSLGDKHLEYLDGHTASPVDHDRRVQPCLTDAQVLALAQLGRQLERLQKCAQDIEFALDSDLAKGTGAGIVLLQCRPVTVLAAGRGAQASGGALTDLASSVLAASRTG